MNARRRDFLRGSQAPYPQNARPQHRQNQQALENHYMFRFHRAKLRPLPYFARGSMEKAGSTLTLFRRAYIPSPRREPAIVTSDISEGI